MTFPDVAPVTSLIMHSSGYTFREKETSVPLPLLLTQSAGGVTFMGALLGIIGQKPSARMLGFAAVIMLLNTSRGNRARNISCQKRRNISYGNQPGNPSYGIGCGTRRTEAGWRTHHMESAVKHIAQKRAGEHIIWNRLWDTSYGNQPEEPITWNRLWDTSRGNGVANTPYGIGCETHCTEAGWRTHHMESAVEHVAQKRAGEHLAWKPVGKQIVRTDRGTHCMETLRKTDLNVQTIEPRACTVLSIRTEARQHA